MTPDQTPMTVALEAYGIDPLNTPESCTLEWTDMGIVVDQYVKQSDEPGDVLCHEGRGGVLVEPVTVRRFFPHPKV